MTESHDVQTTAAHIAKDAGEGIGLYPPINAKERKQRIRERNEISFMMRQFNDQGKAIGYWEVRFDSVNNR